MRLVPFDFIQSSPTSTWTINHNLGCKPVVDVFTSTAGGPYQKVFPSNIEHVDDNTMIITFLAARAGKARLIGQTSDIAHSPVDTYYDRDSTA